MPPSVDAEHVSAAMKAGVLSVHLPKRAPYRPRQIQVQCGPRARKIGERRITPSSKCQRPGDGFRPSTLGSRTSIMRLLCVVTGNIHIRASGAMIMPVPAASASSTRFEEISPDFALLQEVSDDLPRSLNSTTRAGDARGSPWACRTSRFTPSIASTWAATATRFCRDGRSRMCTSRRSDDREAKEARYPCQAQSACETASSSRRARVRSLIDNDAPRARWVRTARVVRSSRTIKLACAPFRRLHERTPIIVGGDLNDVWGTLGGRFLDPAGFVRAGPTANTFPAALPMRPLDALFVRGDLLTHRAAHPANTALTRQASDHLPLVADLFAAPRSNASTKNRRAPNQ